MSLGSLMGEYTTAMAKDGVQGGALRCLRGVAAAASLSDAMRSSPSTCVVREELSEVIYIRRIKDYRLRIIGKT